MLHLIALAAVLVSSVQSIPLNSTLNDPSLHVNVTKRGCDTQAYDYLQGFLRSKMNGIIHREPHYQPSTVNGDLGDKVSKNVQCVLGISDIAGVVTDSRIGTSSELQGAYAHFTQNDQMDHQYIGGKFHDKWISGISWVDADIQNVYQMTKKDASRLAGNYLKEHSIKAALKSMRYVSSQSESTLNIFYDIARLFGAFVPLPISTYDAIEATKTTFHRENVGEDHSNHFKSTHRDRIVVCATYKHTIRYNTPVCRTRNDYQSVHEDGVIDYLHLHFSVNDIKTGVRAHNRDPWLRNNWPGSRH